MSLFGTSPDESTVAPTKSRLSLFDDDVPTPGSKSSLFDDEDNSPAGSPWGIPTPKKAPRGELIKHLLPTSSVPDNYTDVFDNVLKDGDGAGGKISASGVAKVLSAGKLGADDQSQIMSIVAPGGQIKELERSEFNVLLALVGLAQEHEDITLDGVDERRQNLPIPTLPSLSTSAALTGVSEVAAKSPQRPSTPSPPAQDIPQPKQTARKASMDFPDTDDPWGSPALHRGHAHENKTPKSNGAAKATGNGVHEAVRTTSNFTTASVEGSNDESNRDSNAATTAASGIWGSYDGNSNPSFDNPTVSRIGDEGFGVPNDNQERSEPDPPRRSFGGIQSSTGPEENVIITLLPEKEGIFMFQHHNYQVSSPRRNSKVVRRYSDFVWLLDCLQKRYPFRQLPLLPPKRVGVNGNHLAADSTFIEKRRRGLSRFSNALVRHPVLSQEQLVIMFLTVPTELAVWRKQATISVQEEFVGRTLPPGLEDSLSPTLNELFDRTRMGIRRSAEIYINLCNLMDRLSKRNEGLAADHLRLSLSLQSLTDSSNDTYATDTNDVPLLNEGLQATAKHVSNSQSLLEDEARAWDQGVLEDLKRQRDALVSMRDMFDRRDRYDKDNIPYLERRIQNNETKLVGIRGKPEGMVKPGEIEKVTEAIIKDKESIVAQHARGVFVKECIRDELVFFQQSQYHVSRWNQDWAQERVKYSELQADNWKQLHEELESMPIGE
ncbi:sorting nexin mvp1 [Phlyctema vagabunda]|uniref:Sorting nexin MVP1 n=1 Tax=Phlyctema vagabunda TaxID=108571 RepID=A0ABR4PJG9_9HELO